MLEELPPGIAADWLPLYPDWDFFRDLRLVSWLSPDCPAVSEAFESEEGTCVVEVDVSIAVDEDVIVEGFNSTLPIMPNTPAPSMALAYTPAPMARRRFLL